MKSTEIGLNCIVNCFHEILLISLMWIERRILVFPHYLIFTFINRNHFWKYSLFIGKVQVLLRIKSCYSIQFRKKIADKSLNTFEKSYHLQNTQSPCTYLKLNQFFIQHLCITFSMPLDFKYWFWRGKIRLLQVCSRMLTGFTCL